MSRSDDSSGHVRIPREDFDVLRELVAHVKGKAIEVHDEIPFTDEMAEFLLLYSRTGNVTIAAELIDIPKANFYRWKKRNTEFSRQWDAVQKRVADNPNRGQLIVDFLKELLDRRE